MRVAVGLGLSAAVAALWVVCYVVGYGQGMDHGTAKAIAALQPKSEAPKAEPKTAPATEVRSEYRAGQPPVPVPCPAPAPYGNPTRTLQQLARLTVTQLDGTPVWDGAVRGPVEVTQTVDRRVSLLRWTDEDWNGHWLSSPPGGLRMRVSQSEDELRVKVGSVIRPEMLPSPREHRYGVTVELRDGRGNVLRRDGPYFPKAPE